MKRALIFLIILYSGMSRNSVFAQTALPLEVLIPSESKTPFRPPLAPGPAIPPNPTAPDGTISAAIQPALPFREEFVNQIFHTVVDSSFSKYYLCEQAYPCSFVKFDYDEWVKYALQETVTMDVLNELAKKSYYDRKPAYWQQEQLIKARCINEEKTDSILGPVRGLPADNTLSERQQKKTFQKKWEKWRRLPVEERTTFYFSRPLFTDDGQYAIIDLDYRCDVRLCGKGATYLFRHTATGWKLIGEKGRWGACYLP